MGRYVEDLDELIIETNSVSSTGEGRKEASLWTVGSSVSSK